MRNPEAPARFAWLPPMLRPTGAMVWRQEQIFLLVGMAAFFAGFDTNIFGLAAPQIQASFNIPEDQIGTIPAIFRLAVFGALGIAASADLVGRRRLLLITILGQAIATLATAFTTSTGQFLLAQTITRVFGYAEEMLCYVVIAEEMSAGARGWAAGALSGMDYLGAGLVSLLFGAITIMPYGWRSFYVIGAAPMLLLAWVRRRLPETQRFAASTAAGGKTRAMLALLRDLATQYPARVGVLIAAVAAFGFGLGPATVLSSKYLQTVHHYSPGQITILFVSGGFVGLFLTVATGRLSDRLGRKPVTAAMIALSGAAFWMFYSDIEGPALAIFWVLGFYGFFAGEALLAGFALEIVPTQYRATVSGLRYLTEIGLGGLALLFEGRLYDLYGGHGPAMQHLLWALPLSLLAILFLPEPAGKSLEEMTAAPSSSSA